LQMGDRSGRMNPAIGRFLSSVGHLGANSTIVRWRGSDRLQYQNGSELPSDLCQ
jgi:hypothetical protein